MTKTRDVEGKYLKDGVEITFRAYIVETSYSDEVQGGEVLGVEVDALTILGVDVDPIHELPKLPEKLRAEIMRSHREVDWRPA